MKTISNQRGNNVTTVKRANRALVFSTIQDQGPVSRSSVAHLTHLNPSTVGNIVSELAEADLIAETGQTRSTGGRPAALVDVNSQAYLVIGVDLSRDSTRAIVADLAMHRVGSASMAADNSDSSASRLDDIVACTQQLLDRLGSRRDRVIGIGVGAPGPLSVSEGVIMSPPNFGDWSNVPLRSILEQRFGIPVQIENDARACALGERWFGNARRFDNFVYLAVGTGVGSGLVIDGELYRGAHELAGEWGHASIRPDGPVCPCGNVGCLELYASFSALVRYANEAMQRGEISPLRDTLQDKEGSEAAKAVIQAALDGDHIAREAVGRVAHYLGLAVVNIVNVLDPDLVLIGREMAAAGELLVHPIRKMVRKRTFSGNAGKVTVMTGELRQAAPLTGAATLVLSSLVHAPLEVVNRVRKL